jgi:hypothetical protein
MVENRPKLFDALDLVPLEDDLRNVATCSGFLNKNIRHHKVVLMVLKREGKGKLMLTLCLIN